MVCVFPPVVVCVFPPVVVCVFPPVVVCVFDPPEAIDGTPNLLDVTSPTNPVCLIPLSLWYFFTADIVLAPYLPSAPVGPTSYPNLIKAFCIVLTLFPGTSLAAGTEGKSSFKTLLMILSKSDSVNFIILVIFLNISS